MDDVISRQAAIDAHYEYCNKHPDASFPVWSLKILKNLPSAQPDLSGYSDKLWRNAYERGKTEAQCEIVRCKDCKNFRRWIDTDITFCDLTEDRVCKDDFCSKAERRTDE